MKIINKFMPLCFLVLTLILVSCQSIEIADVRGMVTDAYNNDSPVADATVTAYLGGQWNPSAEYTVTTNSSGEYYFNNLPKGNYEIVVLKDTMRGTETVTISGPSDILKTKEINLDINISTGPFPPPAL